MTKTKTTNPAQVPSLDISNQEHADIITSTTGHTRTPNLPSLQDKKTAAIIESLSSKTDPGSDPTTHQTSVVPGTPPQPLGQTLLSSIKSCLSTPSPKPPRVAGKSPTSTPRRKSTRNSSNGSVAPRSSIPAAKPTRDKNKPPTNGSAKKMAGLKQEQRAALPQSFDIPRGHSWKSSSGGGVGPCGSDDDEEEYRRFVRSLWCFSANDELASFLSKSLPNDDDDEASYCDEEEEEDEDHSEEEDNLVTPMKSSKASPSSSSATHILEVSASTPTSKSNTSPVSSSNVLINSPTPQELHGPFPLENASEQDLYNELEAELGGLLEEDLEAAVTTLLQPPTLLPLKKTHPKSQPAAPPKINNQFDNNPIVSPRPPPITCSAFLQTPKSSITTLEPRYTKSPNRISRITPSQFTQLLTLLTHHYQILLQQSILAIRQANFQKLSRDKTKQTHNPPTTPAPAKTESCDDLLEILDGSVGMLQDLEQLRKDAYRNGFCLSNNKITRSRLRDSLRMGRHPRDKRRQKHGEVVTAFDVKGLSELTETFGEIDQSVFGNGKETNVLRVEKHGEACHLLLKKAGADIHLDYLPNYKDLSECITFPKEVFGQHFAPPCTPQQQLVLRKNRNQFTASEDNLVLRGINLYGEKEWLLLSDRFLPNRSVSIISQRYNRLCLLFYKSNGIRIDEEGDLLPAPDNPPPNWEARAKIVLTKVPSPAKFNVHRWSLLEDITILKAVPIMGRMWAELANGWISHRDRGHLRKRYQVLERRCKGTVRKEKKRLLLESNIITTNCHHTHEGGFAGVNQESQVGLMLKRKYMEETNNHIQGYHCNTAAATGSAKKITTICTFQNNHPRLNGSSPSSSSSSSIHPQTSSVFSNSTASIQKQQLIIPPTIIPLPPHKYQIPNNTNPFSLKDTPGEHLLCNERLSSHPPDSNLLSQFNSNTNNMTTSLFKDSTTAMATPIISRKSKSMQAVIEAIKKSNTPLSSSTPNTVATLSTPPPRNPYHTNNTAPLSTQSDFSRLGFEKILNDENYQDDNDDTQWSILSKVKKLVNEEENNPNSFQDSPSILGKLKKLVNNHAPFDITPKTTCTKTPPAGRTTVSSLDECPTSFTSRLGFEKILNESSNGWSNILLPPSTTTTPFNPTHEKVDVEAVKAKLLHQQGIESFWTNGILSDAKSSYSNLEKLSHVAASNDNSPKKIVEEEPRNILSNLCGDNCASPPMKFWTPSSHGKRVASVRSQQNLPAKKRYKASILDNVLERTSENYSSTSSSNFSGVQKRCPPQTNRAVVDNVAVSGTDNRNHPKLHNHQPNRNYSLGELPSFNLSLAGNANLLVTPMPAIAGTTPNTNNAKLDNLTMDGFTNMMELSQILPLSAEKPRHGEDRSPADINRSLHPPANSNNNTPSSPTSNLFTNPPPSLSMFSDKITREGYASRNSTTNNNTNTNPIQGIAANSLMAYDLEAITALNSMSHLSPAIAVNNAIAAGPSPPPPQQSSSTCQTDLKEASKDQKCKKPSFFARAVGSIQEKSNHRKKNKDGGI